MAKDTFVLLSLEDSKSKELASAISSGAAKKILTYLGSKEESSATEISKELKMPLATVEYNLNLLLKAGLLESPEFKWSEKGKKVDIYKVAKKLIIISPKGTEGLASKLSSLLPAVLITAVGSIAIYFYQKSLAVPELMMGTAESFDAAPALLMKSSEVVQPVVQEAAANPLVYFLLGASLAIFSMVLYSCYYYWRSKQ